MKTLNEVIKDLKDELPKTCEDAIWYLEEFQGLCKMWNDKLDKEQENKSLDCKELEIGKPYWIEIDYGLYWSGRWEIPEDTETDDYGQYLVMQSGRKLRRFDDGWKAYKKEQYD